MVEVEFRPCGKTYFFDPGELEVKKGDRVVAENPRGLELGTIVRTGMVLTDPKVLAEVKPLTRLAEPEDLKNQYENRFKAERAFKEAQAKIVEHQLPMKLVEVAYTIDGSKIVFYFTSEGRVDFRELVKDLAKTFRKRIELFQIGVRDEAKRVGGLGPCGLEVCCCRFLREFAPVSIKMVKNQNLTLNPTKTSGSCGRLICCLGYEHEAYQEALKALPPSEENNAETQEDKAPEAQAAREPRKPAERADLGENKTENTGSQPASAVQGGKNEEFGE